MWKLLFHSIKWSFPPSNDYVRRWRDNVVLDINIFNLDDDDGDKDDGVHVGVKPLESEPKAKGIWNVIKTKVYDGVVYPTNY